MSKITDKLIEKNGIFLTTVSTLITGIITATTVVHSAPLTYVIISCTFFLTSVCAIIAQLMLLSYRINDRHKSSHSIIEEIKDNTIRNRNLLLPKNPNDEVRIKGLKSKILEVINQGNVHYIKIICYGTRGFDGLISDLKQKNILTDVLMCSPYSKQILYDGDGKEIEKTEKENNVDHICFKKSSVPPTIRACVLYNKDKRPLWSSIQSYYFNYDSENHSLDYRSSFAVIASEEDNYKLLKEMDVIIKEEFDRLKNFDLKKEGLNDGQIKTVRHIEEKGYISIREYCKINGKNISDLECLEGKKILKKETKTKGKRTIEIYVLAKNGI